MAGQAARILTIGMIVHLYPDLGRRGQHSDHLTSSEWVKGRTHHATVSRH
jgi:hypothetical protein